MNASRPTMIVAAVIALALASCGEDAAEEPVADAPDTETTEETDAAEETDDADEGGATVATASVDLGEVLVDGDGMTLYLFDPDEQGESTCYDDCEANWPPLLTDGDPQAGDGADASLLGTTEREDGSIQVTYDGWPVYHWAGDEAEGDTNGQGVNGIWWVVQPDGTPIRDDDAGEADDDAGEADDDAGEADDDAGEADDDAGDDGGMGY